MEKTNQSLIILIPGFPADEQDNNCLPFPQAFIKNLKELYPFLAIRVYTFQYPFFRGQYEWNGIKVNAFNGRNRGKLDRIHLWYKIQKTLKKILKKERPIGILNFWMGETAAVAKYLAWKFSIPYFTWLMGQDARPGNPYIKLLRPKPSSLIALSDFISEEIFKNYGLKVKNIIPAGIDTREFPEPGKKRSIDLLGAGTLKTLKQYDLFIRVVARLRRDRPDIRAVLCGKGPEDKRLNDLVREYGLKDNIEMSGEINHPELLSLMQCSRILLHPSSYEGFSTVCAEALYAGMHVVSFTHPMNLEFNHWHRVNSLEEMISTTEDLLKRKNLEHLPVLCYPMASVCRKIILLFTEFKENDLTTPALETGIAQNP